MNFVTVDEVGEVDEEEEKEVIETRTRGQAKKRTRQTPGNTQTHTFVSFIHVTTRNFVSGDSVEAGCQTC